MLKSMLVFGCGKLDIFDLVGWLVVLYVPSTARSFRDGTPIYCPLRTTLVFTPSPPEYIPGIEPRVVAWQSITLPLRHASSTFDLVYGKDPFRPKHIKLPMVLFSTYLKQLSSPLHLPTLEWTF